ncbi:MAG: hypothetical protein AVDCRST_MAG10-532, partial [uncultured Acidimicrobiales bacterium]
DDDHDPESRRAPDNGLGAGRTGGGLDRSPLPVLLGRPLRGVRPRGRRSGLDDAGFRRRRRRPARRLVQLGDAAAAAGPRHVRRRGRRRRSLLSAGDRTSPPVERLAHARPRRSWVASRGPPPAPDPAPGGARAPAVAARRRPPRGGGCRHPRRVGAGGHRGLPAPRATARPSRPPGRSSTPRRPPPAVHPRAGGRPGGEHRVTVHRLRRRLLRPRRDHAHRPPPGPLVGPCGPPARRRTRPLDDRRVQRPQPIAGGAPRVPARPPLHPLGPRPGPL